MDAASIGSSQILRSVRLRMKSHGLKRHHDYKGLLQSSPAEWDELVESVVVTETWFFRDNDPFAALFGLVQEWLSSNAAGRVRLLSLPCSSGEEPYSLAMTLLGGGISPDRFEIDAVDISARALARADRAVYGKNSFRGKDLGFKNRYFQPNGEGFVLKPEVRKTVRFCQANVLAEHFRTANANYDFIFCRNLLIYFDRPTQQKALSRIGTLLAPEGVLFVGAAEQPLVIDHGFVSAQIPMAFACRKPTAKPVPGGDRMRAAKSPGLVLPAKAVQANGQPQSHRSPPEPEKADLETARRLADAGRLDEAAKICETHVRENGASAQAYYLLGLVRDAAGDPTAQDYYRKALYLEPNHYESLLQLALWAEKNGEVAGARRLKIRAQRAKPKT
jgi:chemotaxis protein methyltransferase WspC